MTIDSANPPLTPNEFSLVGLKSGALVCNNPHDFVWKDWCSHLGRLVKNNQDADFLHAGMTVDCPVFPVSNIFAQVTIGDPIATGAGLMWMTYMPDIGREQKHGLGFWNPGEGMWSIRTVILDFLKSRLDPNETFSRGRILTKCPATSTHTMKHARLVKDGSTNDSNWKSVCLWNIVMENACTPCLKATQNDPDDNYGLGGAVPAGRGLGGAPWS